MKLALCGGECQPLLQVPPAGTQGLPQSLGPTGVSHTGQILEVAYDFQVPLLNGKLKSICFALHTQVCDIAQLPRSENQVKVFYCLHLLVQEMSKKKCELVKAMRCTLGDLSTEVKKAILHFSRTLLNVQGLDDVAWDLVAYIFKQFSLSSSQLKSKNHSSQDAEEEQSIRATYVEILENLDVSISGMSQVGDQLLLLHYQLGNPCRALLLLGIITPKFIGQVLQWVTSTTENLRVTGTAFISQLICDPTIKEQKLLKPVIRLLQQ
ncbi:hypothetical protein Y1Q_0023590 [Alligator mississippiensis]|uniref:MROH2B-like HEAT-repeats domain-containing protein n=1 Tax=Alligator mississippiensis TaxID=8496 RepID=A0A151MMT7_ALLMI|nr:hypothetical protein Y1Q_0023590 [Alligator mississippiensis]